MRELRPANVIDLRNTQDSGAGADLFPLTVEDLTYQAGGTVLIKGIDLSLDAGGVTVIMGPNGAGKSLLLRLMHEPQQQALARAAGAVRRMDCLGRPAARRCRPPPSGHGVPARGDAAPLGRREH